MKLIEFIITATLLTLMPGPDIIFIMTQSIVSGAKNGVKIATGLVSGLIIHTMIIATGIAVIVKDNLWLMDIIKYAGAAYMVYLAVLSIMELKHTVNNTEDIKNINNSKEFWSLYKKGIIMNLLNPKIIIFFLALFPQFISNDTKYPEMEIIILGVIFSLIALIIFSLVSIFSGCAAKYIIPNKNSKIIPLVKFIVYLGISAMLLF